MFSAFKNSGSTHMKVQVHGPKTVDFRECHRAEQRIRAEQGRI